MKDKNYGFLCLLCGNTGETPALIKERPCFPLPELKPLSPKCIEAENAKEASKQHAVEKARRLQLEALQREEKKLAQLLELKQLQDLAKQLEEDDLKEAMRRSKEDTCKEQERHETAMALQRSNACASLRDEVPTPAETCAAARAAASPPDTSAAEAELETPVLPPCLPHTATAEAEPETPMPPPCPAAAAQDLASACNNMMEAEDAAQHLLLVPPPSQMRF